jgi:uncharacterized membrane protein (DUF485 family)
MRLIEHANTAQIHLYDKLLLEKKRFIIPATIFLLCFYFALPLLTSYLPELMNVRIWGKISIAWILAFSQFIMTWVIGSLYLWNARRLDAIVNEIRKASSESSLTSSIKQEGENR